MAALLAGVRLGFASMAHARIQMDAGSFERDAEALQRTKDWAALASLAQLHRVAGFVWQGVRAARELVQPSATRPLQVVRDRLVRRAGRQLHQLKRAVDVLRDREIPYLVLKGLPLSRRLYAHPWVRGSVDIDMMIPSDSILAADRALKAVGWDRKYPIVPDRMIRNRWYRRYGQHLELQGPTGMLELHWRYSHPSYHPATFETLHAGSRSVRVGNAAFAALGDEDDFVFLAAHGARHFWSRLVWLCDMVLALAAMEPKGARRALAKCADAGLDGAPATALRLARDWLGTTIPGARPASLRAGPRFVVRHAPSGWTGTRESRLKRRLRRKCAALAVKRDARSTLEELGAWTTNSIMRFAHRRGKRA